MTIDVHLAAEIRRWHFAEKWPVHTIASNLGVHGDVVRRAVGHAPAARDSGKPTRAEIMAPWSQFVHKTLEEFPKLCSTRLYDMLCARGFAGSERTVRRYVHSVRPRPRGETFVHPQPLMGQQSQIDWMHVGKLPVLGGVRDVWIFVMVLSYSRAMWAELLFDLSAYAVRRSLLRAVSALGGCTRQWLFDNPKTIVTARHGKTICFHPLLVELSEQLLVRPDLCAVRRPETKGRVERAVRFVRERFLAARELHNLAEGAKALDEFIQNIAMPRAHPEIAGQTVAQVFAQEQQHLLPLATPMPPLEVCIPGRVDKYALVRFDGNRYSVPAQSGSGPCTIAFADALVRVLIEGAEVARHPRCWGRRQICEISEHRQHFNHRGPRSRACVAHDRMRRATPEIDRLMQRWIEHGRNRGSMAARTAKLLDLYGDAVFAEAVSALLTTELFDPSALAHLCDQIRARQNMPIPVPVVLSSHVVDADVDQHSLEKYDAK